ncbi:MAG: fructosamine kinase family protein [Verrucomicrobiales bacterium]|nr:fructosamine kinase family protein [Verrucomicrobiales bacterium]
MSLSEPFREIEAAAGISLNPDSTRRVSGGCTHETLLADTGEGKPFFLKLGSAGAVDQFLTEKRGLELLRDSKTIRVPEPFFAGISDNRAFLVLEALPLRPFSPGDQEKLGLELAEMHQTVSPTNQFGCDFDNFIGATPQPNPWTNSWAEFFTEHRLGHQFRLAEAAGNPFPEAAKLTGAIRPYLAGLDISPALVHGDLWGGNASDTEEGSPVIFDPAPYFGDREVDIAFTTLFGGFDDSFYKAYRSIHPAPDPLLHAIYNLYHLLNHNYLFGGHYRDQSMHSMNAILRALT